MMHTDTGTYKRNKKLNISALPNLLCTVLICLACWYIGYDYWIGFPVRSGDGTSLLWHAVCGFFTDKDITYYAGFSLLFLAVALVQRFNFRFVIVRGKTVLPFLFFLLLNSVNPDFFPIRPISIAIFLILFAMFELFGSYQNQMAAGRMFNMMFFLCVGSLIWPYILWLIPVFWIGMYQFRILNIRTFSATLLGLFTFFLFLSGWSIWKHDSSVFINMVQCLSDFRIVFANESRLTEWPKPLCFCFLMIVLLFHISSQETEQSIRTRHFLSFLFMFGFYAFILSFFYADTFVDFECVFYLSTSLLASYALSEKYGIALLILYYLLIVVLIVFLFIRLWNFL
jgi:hypothetical protein